MPHAIFDDPRLARVYDPLDPDRSDLDAYVTIIGDVGASSVLDVGCGTGTLACRLAADGLTVIGVDPALASVDVARGKPHADRVRWIHGDATALPPLSVDIAVMTGNVAQLFVSDDDWQANLRGIRGALGRNGWLVFESRVPARRAWERWTPELTHTVVEIDGVGPVESWNELVDVDGDLVTFCSMIRFVRTALLLQSQSTLRFRSLDEVRASLVATGFNLVEVRDAPDRPGLEHVYVATRR